MRLEFLQQSVEEEVNVTNPLHSQDDFSFVPLFGLGVDYVLVEGEPVAAPPAPVAGTKGGESKKVVAPTVTPKGPPRVELYGTVSQAYRPRTYGELVPTPDQAVW
jgi:outer membrane receptor protein involved in Fe transport